MTFTVSDFHDLVEILEEQPAWRAELRRLVLTEEVLGLPQALRDLAQSVRELAESQRRYEERHEARFDRVESDIHTLKSDVAVLKTDVKSLDGRVGRLADRMGRVDGRTFEQQVRDRLPTYLSRFALRLRRVNSADLADLLDDAVEESRITEEEMEDAKLIDAVARGRRRSDGETIYLGVEVSVSMAPHDLERAIRRAVIITAAAKIETLPVIVGEVISAELRAEADRRGVGYVVVAQD